MRLYAYGDDPVLLRASIVRKCVERGKGKRLEPFSLGCVPSILKRYSCKGEITTPGRLLALKLWLSLFQKCSHCFFVILTLEKIVQTKGFGLHCRIKIAGRPLYECTF